MINQSPPARPFRRTSTARRQHGQNLIEMAILTPLLLLLLVGVLDFSRVFNQYIVVTNASREGARYASRFPNDTGGIQQAAIDEAASSGVSLAPSDVAIAPSNAAAGTEVRVTVTLAVSTFLGSYIGYPNLTVGATTGMVVFGLDS